MLRPLRNAIETWKPVLGEGEPIAALAAAWRNVVGERVAENTAPVALNGSTLVVTTRSSAWSNQLQMLSPQILSGLRALPEGRDVERLTFRVGAVKRKAQRNVPHAARPARANGPASEPAADAREALERLRVRMQAVRRRASHVCERCGMPLEDGAVGPCAPCNGEIEQERVLAAQRILFAAPWLGFAELREAIPGFERAEHERARRQLLQRWWTTLQRTRRTKRLSAGEIERPIASSYVLLQSGLTPDRITPAVVRNLLGEELEALVWGPAPDSSKIERR